MTSSSGLCTWACLSSTPHYRHYPPLSQQAKTKYQKKIPKQKLILKMKAGAREMVQQLRVNPLPKDPSPVPSSMLGNSQSPVIPDLGGPTPSSSLHTHPKCLCAHMEHRHTYKCKIKQAMKIKQCLSENEWAHEHRWTHEMWCVSRMGYHQQGKGSRYVLNIAEPWKQLSEGSRSQRTTAEGYFYLTMQRCAAFV